VSNLTLLGKILRLKGMKITAFEFRDYGRGLHLSVKPHKNGSRCPHCGQRGRIVPAKREARVWEDLTIFGL